MTTEYCWTLPGIGPRGPFSSIKDAERDSREIIEGRSEEPHTVEIRECDPICPEDWADCYTAEDVLEKMDQYLCDNVMFDDRVFDITSRDHKQAENDLTDFMRRWAAKYVVTSSEWQAGELVKTLEIP